NSRTHIGPTSIDLNVYSRSEARRNTLPVIGWIGTPSNLKYLRILEDPLLALRRRHDFVFKIITDVRYRNQIPFSTKVPYELVGWSLEDFVSSLSTFDIGVGPLPNDPWTVGKGGYKLLEYMAM